jgi:membrane carboxypeptidase/penicillin-binding protein PbpC
VGVWIGNSDYQTMQDVNGLTGAVPIWQKTLRAILQNRLAEAFVRPPEVTYRLSDELALSDQQLPIETAAWQPRFGPYLLWWQLSVGTHQFWAQGLSAEGETGLSNIIQITVAQ